MVRVSVNIVTFNSEDDIVRCIESLRAQTFKDFRVRVYDNASADRTMMFLRPYDIDFVRSFINTGFAKAHNHLLRAFRAEYALILNPDTILEPRFIEELVRALDEHPAAASASGKLLRLDGITIDSTGIVMRREQRHLDRGADEPDIRQYDRPEEIFGPSGAAAFYRQSALDDVAIDAEYFDEDFFAYREDADLAWRCRLAGWKSIYVPSAVARHRRRVTPERRRDLPNVINYHSVKNRFLLRINNLPASLYDRDFAEIAQRDAVVVAYVLLWEWSSIPALWYVARHFPRLWRKRRRIQAKSRVQPEEIAVWFT